MFDLDLDSVIPEELRQPVDESVLKGELSWEQFFNQVRHADKVVRNRRGWPLFKQVFSVSALRNIGLQDLKVFLHYQLYIYFGFVLYTSFFYTVPIFVVKFFCFFSGLTI